MPALRASSAATAAISAAPPVNTTSPTIAGATLRGDTLTSTQGAWSGLGNAYSYQWQRSSDGSTWTNITGATASSYTLAVADEGDTVRLLITVVNPDATVSAATPATATVSASAPANTAAPAVSGPPQRGLTLVSAQGTWNGIGNTYAFQWQRSPDGSTWTNIAGATNSSYQVAVADEGGVVRVLVTASNADDTVSAASPPTTTVSPTPPVNTVAPTITGSVQRGGTLVSSAGTWLGAGNTLAYQWQRSTDGTTWTNIGGATAVSYPLGVVDEGSQIRLLITASNVDGSSSAASAPTTTVPVAAPVNTAPPTISGTARRGLAPQRHARHLERHRQHPGVSVAALHRWHELERRRGRDGHHLHAGDRRRGGHDPRSRDRRQPRWDGERAQRGQRGRRRVAAGQHRLPDERDRQAGQLAVLHQRGLERDAQQPDPAVATLR